MMLQRFRNNAEIQHLLASGQEVLLAVSGGRDSVAMTHLFHHAAIPFSIAHCNFNLRPGHCDRDQAFVEQLAADLHVVCHTTSFDTHSYAASHGMSIEEAARQLRYEWFSTLCRQHGYAALATAHHRDDSIETFFLNLLRGTGIAGLHGIRPNSQFSTLTSSTSLHFGKESKLSLRSTSGTPNSQFSIIRPLLCFSRAEIDAYIEENRLGYVEDYTNAELDAFRNRIRHRLIPLLRELSPSFDATMAANIERLHDTETLYRAHIDLLRSRLVKPYPSRLPDLPFQILSIDPVALPEPRTTVLFELLRPYAFNASTVSDIIKATSSSGQQPASGSRQPSGKIFFSPTHIAELHRGLLLLAPQSQPSVPNSQFSTLNSQFSTRPWRPGDRFRPKGMQGTRLVSDFLKDLHLSRIERQYVRVLVDPNDRILSVLHLRDAEI
jgi:tRNA(Ile)-lysidine synthase